MSDQITFAPQGAQPFTLTIEQIWYVTQYLNQHVCGCTGGHAPCAGCARWFCEYCDLTKGGLCAACSTSSLSGGQERGDRP